MANTDESDDGEIGVEPCEHCGGDHVRKVIPVKGRALIRDVICSEGPRAYSNDAICDGCDRNMAGETFIRTPGPDEWAGSKGGVRVCRVCFTRIMEGALVETINGGGSD